MSIAHCRVKSIQRRHAMLECLHRLALAKILFINSTTHNNTKICVESECVCYSTRNVIIITIWGVFIVDFVVEILQISLHLSGTLPNETGLIIRFTKPHNPSLAEQHIAHLFSFILNKFIVLWHVFFYHEEKEKEFTKSQLKKSQKWD